jgi:hypothetical protein
MRRFLTALAIWLAAAMPAAAQQTEIETVIADQFERFRADDFAAAFEHASPTIRGLFGTPENFGAMVRNGYPMVHRPKSFRFLDFGEGRRGLRQIVEVEDIAGRRHLLAYEMIETENGWKINGVQLLPPPDVAA